MKTYNKPATSKLVARFDRELKNLLMEDLKALKQVKNQLFTVIKSSHLSVA
jgi:hypothetical protein